MFIHYEIHICLEIKHSNFCLHAQIAEDLIAEEFSILSKWWISCYDQAGEINSCSPPQNGIFESEEQKNKKKTPKKHRVNPNLDPGWVLRRRDRCSGAKCEEMFTLKGAFWAQVLGLHETIMSALLRRLWEDQSSTRLHLGAFDEFSCRTQLALLRTAREQSWAPAAFADVSKYLPVQTPPPPTLSPTTAVAIVSEHPRSGMLRLRWAPKTIKREELGRRWPPHPPTPPDCRRWPKALLKRTSLITSQLCGAVWHPSPERLLQERDFSFFKQNKTSQQNN